jgi:hypothetical protein
MKASILVTRWLPITATAILAAAIGFLASRPSTAPTEKVSATREADGSLRLHIPASMQEAMERRTAKRGHMPHPPCPHPGAEQAAFFATADQEQRAVVQAVGDHPWWAEELFLGPPVWRALAADPARYLRQCQDPVLPATYRWALAEALESNTTAWRLREHAGPLLDQEDLLRTLGVLYNLQRDLDAHMAVHRLSRVIRDRFPLAGPEAIRQALCQAGWELLDEDLAYVLERHAAPRNP